MKITERTECTMQQEREWLLVDLEKERECMDRMKQELVV